MESAGRPHRESDMTTRLAIGLAFASGFFATAALAQEIQLGDLRIEQPWSRATPKGSPVAGGYLTIRNTGATADRLTGGSSDVAKDVQVHEMSMDGGVMKMRQLVNGLEIPPGGSVDLKPGGYHLMLLSLSKQLNKGETLPITLTFERAGKVTVDFKVGGIGDTGPLGSPSAPSMDQGMNMTHGPASANH
jgi:copper(I)-binding protein